MDGRYISKDTWFDGDGKPFQPQVHYFVGGATKLYGAALYRLRPGDFSELRHVSSMLTTAEIAGELYISSNTVKSHIKHICHKLAATHRGEAVRRARQLQLI